MKKETVSSVKKKVWTEFSLYIRTRDCLKTMGRPDWGKCYTCGVIKERKDLQAGHFIPGRHTTQLFDEEQVRAQCYHCNIGLSGNWPKFWINMTEEYGKDKVEEMVRKKKEVKQFKIPELKELLEKYRQLNKNPVS